MIARTFLAPGQRYTDVTADPWRLEHQLTIVHIDAQSDDEPSVIYRSFNGDEEIASARQFEAAILSGLIVPVVGAGAVAAC